MDKGGTITTDELIHELNRMNIQIAPELAEAFDIDRYQRGAVVAEVQEDSAAAKAGIEAGDVVVEVDGKSVLSSAQLRNAVGLRRVGDKLKITVLRDGKERKMVATLTKAQALKLAENDGQVGKFLNGATLQDAEDRSGVIVAQIDPASPAASSGLRSGDLIVSVNRQRVRSVQDFSAVTSKSGDRILLRVLRGRAALWIVLNG